LTPKGLRRLYSSTVPGTATPLDRVKDEPGREVKVEFLMLLIIHHPPPPSQVDLNQDELYS
jgi:hypothetical protein